MYTDCQIVKVPAVIKERKGVLPKCGTYKQQSSSVLIAVILHNQNIALGVVKQVQSPISYWLYIVPIRLNEHMADDDCRVVHGNYLK